MASPPNTGSSLAVALRPMAGEALSGFVRRLAAANGLDSLHQLSRILGLIRINATGGEEQWAALARGLDVPTSFLEALRLPAKSSRRSQRVRWDGVDVRTSQIASTRLRACPKCVDEGRVVRGHWQIHLVTACSDHMTQLQDACPTCTRPIRFCDPTYLWHCPDCATGFSEAVAPEAGTGELAVLACLGRGPTSAIPHPLIGLDAEARLSVVERLGTLALTAAADAPLSGSSQKFLGRHDPIDPGRPIAESGRIAEAALPLLLDWPDNLRRLLADLVDRYPPFDSDMPLLRRIGSKAGHLAAKPLLSGGRPVEIVEAERTLFLRETVEHVEHAKPSLARTTRFAHLDHLAVEAGLPDADYMPRSNAARALGARNAAVVASWIEAGGLPLHRCADGSHAITARAVAELSGKLAALSSQDDAKRLTNLYLATRSCTRSYPPADLFRDVLGGYVRCAVRQDAGNATVTLAVSLADVERRRAIAHLATCAIRGERLKLADIVPRTRAIWPGRDQPTAGELVGAGVHGPDGMRNTSGHMTYPVAQVLAYLQRVDDRERVFDLGLLPTSGAGGWRLIVYTAGRPDDAQPGRLTNS